MSKVFTEYSDQILDLEMQGISLFELAFLTTEQNIGMSTWAELEITNISN
jgi:hypothetical protein